MAARVQVTAVCLVRVGQLAGCAIAGYVYALLQTSCDWFQQRDGLVRRGVIACALGLQAGMWSMKSMSCTSVTD
jgi:hypothetical protein